MFTNIINSIIILFVIIIAYVNVVRVCELGEDDIVSTIGWNLYKSEND